MEDILVRFRLIGDEAEALEKLADMEYRHPRDQIRFLLKQELLRRGLIQATAQEPIGDGVSLQTSPEGQV